MHVVVVSTKIATYSYLPSLGLGQRHHCTTIKSAFILINFLNSQKFNHAHKSQSTDCMCNDVCAGYVLYRALVRFSFRSA